MFYYQFISPVCFTGLVRCDLKMISFLPLTSWNVFIWLKDLRIMIYILIKSKFIIYLCYEHPQCTHEKKKRFLMSDFLLSSFPSAFRYWSLLIFILFLYFKIYFWFNRLDGWLVGSHGISTFVGRLTANLFYANSQFYFSLNVKIIFNWSY